MATSICDDSLDMSFTGTPRRRKRMKSANANQADISCKNRAALNFHGHFYGASKFSCRPAQLCVGQRKSESFRLL
jgi:hypothetical protein